MFKIVFKVLGSFLETLCVFGGQLVFAAYDMENLNRGLVAVRANEQVFISWRWLGHEPDDIAFHVYRQGKRLTTTPIKDKTFFIDKNPLLKAKYAVAAVIAGRERSPSKPVSPWGDLAKKIPLNRPAGGTTPDGVEYSYSPNDATVADLDGDGEYEIVLKWNPSNAKDNAHKGYTGNVYIDAYELDGQQRWRLDLGRNIRAGAHYTQFIVYDFDSDGYAEVALRTSDGSVDGQGQVIGNPDADYRNKQGYVLRGREFLSIFNGETGALMASTEYVPARGVVSSWGDNYGNRVDRFLAGLAWLDGEKPSLIMARGYYTRAVVVAWDWRDGKLSQRWVADSNQASHQALAGQGAHSLSVADVDADGKQEIIYGAATLDHNGALMYSTQLGHGDALHVGDLNPRHPGLEVYMVHESPPQYGDYGSEMHEAATGKILWGASGENTDVGRGVAMDVDPRYAGAEAWATQGGGIFSSTGKKISTARPARVNFGIWWDGDLGRELLDANVIEKWDYKNNRSDTLLNGGRWSAVSNNGTKATPVLSADILGDWREEVIWRTASNDALLLFTTTLASSHRLRTLMHDPQYRAAIAWQNVVYNQPPHPSFFLGYNMPEPPAKEIKPVVKAKRVPAKLSRAK